MPPGNKRMPADEDKSESALEKSIALEKLAERVYQLIRKELRLELVRTKSSMLEGDV